MIIHNIAQSALVLQICHFVFAQDACKPRDCVDLKCYGLSKTTDGPHIIYPYNDTDQTLNVSCDNSKLGGGWIVFQRRVEGGTLNFTRLWDDYRNGFGDPGDETTEFWLGNEHVYQLVSRYGRPVEGYIGATAYDMTSCDGLVSGFQLQDEAHDYRLLAAFAYAPHCSSKDLTSMFNHPFRTLDHQLGTQYKTIDCFKTHSAGWWYYNYYRDKCYDTFLNGPHRPKGVQNEDAIFMRAFGKQLKASFMMFRPTNYSKRLMSCINPCINKPKTICVFEPAKHRHRCVCPPPLCGPDCSGPCENGGACVLDVCECAVGFEGPLCHDTVNEADDTTSAEDTTLLTRNETTSTEDAEQTKSNIGIIVVGIIALLFVVGVAAFFVIRTIQKEKAESAAAAAAAAEEAEEEESIADETFDLTGYISDIW